MLPERKTGGYRIRPYDIIDILYTNAAAGVRTHDPQRNGAFKAPSGRELSP